MALNLFLGIIFASFSVISCSVFLYYFVKYDSVKYTFGMKHIAILQLSDLLLTFSWIVPVYILASFETYCMYESFMLNSFLIFQSFWIAIISRYNYQTICLNVDKDTISIVKPAVFGILLSVTDSILCLSLGCYRTNDTYCIMRCEPYLEYPLTASRLAINFTSWFLSFYYNWFLLKKLRKDLKNQSKEMRWSFFRLSVYPFISFVCILPALCTFTVLKITGSYNLILLDFSFCGLLLIGFFNSIALGFTREFREALRFSKKIKIKPLIN